MGGFLGGRWDGVRRWLVQEDSKQGKEAKEREKKKRFWRRGKSAGIRGEQKQRGKNRGLEVHTDLRHCGFLLFMFLITLLFMHVSCYFF